MRGQRASSPAPQLLTVGYEIQYTSPGISSLSVRLLVRAKSAMSIEDKEVLKVARTFQPLGDRVIVKPVEREEVSAGGIVLPDTAQEKPQEGEVVAVGPGRAGDDGKRVAMEAQVGDIVIYSKYAGSELKEEGQDYLVLRESDILAKVS